MKCPLNEEHGELLLHLTLEPSFGMRKTDKETLLPQISAIECRGGCLFPKGEVIHQTISLVYFTTTQHIERLNLIDAKKANEITIENMGYESTISLLMATLGEAVKRYQRNQGFYPK